MPVRARGRGQSIKSGGVFIWDATTGEVQVCEREPHNVEDCYTIAVKTVIGHLPRNLSRVCSLFI